MVCDGHGGNKASKFSASIMRRYLVQLLPPQLPNFSDQQGEGMVTHTTTCPHVAQHDLLHGSAELKDFSVKVQLAVCEAFVNIDNEWMERRHNSGESPTGAEWEAGVSLALTLT
jgi:serine/threonine protein phosphatase PrpC